MELRRIPMDIWAAMLSHLKSRHHARLELTGDPLVQRALRHARLACDFDQDVPKTPLVVGVLLKRAEHLFLSDDGWRRWRTSSSSNAATAIHVPFEHSLGRASGRGMLDVAHLAPQLVSLRIEITFLSFRLILPATLESVSIVANDGDARSGGLLSAIDNLSSLARLSSLEVTTRSCRDMLSPHLAFPPNLTALSLAVNDSDVKLLHLLPRSLETLSLTSGTTGGTFSISTLQEHTRLVELVTEGSCVVALDAIPPSVRHLRLRTVECAGSVVDVFSRVVRAHLDRFSFRRLSFYPDDLDEWVAAVTILLPSLTCLEDVECLITASHRFDALAPLYLQALRRLSPANGYDCRANLALRQSLLLWHSLGMSILDANAGVALCGVAFAHPKLSPADIRPLASSIDFGATSCPDDETRDSSVPTDRDAAYQNVMRLCALRPSSLQFHTPPTYEMPDESAANVRGIMVHRFTTELDLRTLLSNRLDTLERLEIDLNLRHGEAAYKFGPTSCDFIAAVIKEQLAKTLPLLEKVVMRAPAVTAASFAARMAEARFYARPGSDEYTLCLRRPSWATPSSRV